MAKIKIETDRCKGCALCIDVCPKKSLIISDKFNKAGHHPAVFVEGNECTGCGFCYLVCPEVCVEVDKD
ncbi:MAG: ferredoxin family protein [Elusimicrobiota bacterium]